MVIAKVRLTEVKENFDLFLSTVPDEPKMERLY